MKDSLSRRMFATVKRKRLIVKRLVTVCCISFAVVVLPYNRVFSFSMSSQQSAECSDFYFQKETVAPGRVEKFRLFTDASMENRVSYQQVIGYLATNEMFRFSMINTIKQSPFKGFFFETPPVSFDTLLSKPFEFVLVNSPALAGLVEADADDTSFSHYTSPFDNKVADKVVQFHNLGGDALLVVPCKNQATSSISYSHFANFIRQASPPQVDEFFKQIGLAAQNRFKEIGADEKMWLSTSGLGVFWLHVRLDSVPKYYQYSPYRVDDYE